MRVNSYLFRVFGLGLSVLFFSSYSSAMGLSRWCMAGDGPQCLMDPCLTKAEAKQAVSQNKNEVLVFSKSDLSNIVKNNNDAMEKLSRIDSDRIMVLPRADFGLSNKCKNGGVQVYFAYIDLKSELVKNYYDRSRA